MLAHVDSSAIYYDPLLHFFKKTALIITGPLDSVGKTGADLKEQVGRMVSFNCRPYVQQWSEQPFGMTALITWTGEQVLDLRHSKIPVVQVPSSGVPECSQPQSRNKYRQSVLIQKGTAFAIESGYELVLRVRTDQIFEPRALRLEDFVFAERGFVVAAPALHKYTLSDFTFLGRADLLHRWFSRHLAMGELSEDVHEDLLRHLVALNGKVSFLHYPLLGAPVNVLQREAILDSHRQVVREFNPMLMDTMLWRGNQIDPAWASDRDSDQELRQPRGCRANSLVRSLSSLVWTDWFRFCRRSRPFRERNLLRKIQFRVLLAYSCVVIGSARLLSSKRRITES